LILKFRFWLFLSPCFNFFCSCVQIDSNHLTGRGSAACGGTRGAHSAVCCRLAQRSSKRRRIEARMRRTRSVGATASSCPGGVAQVSRPVRPQSGLFFNFIFFKTFFQRNTIKIINCKNILWRPATGRQGLQGPGCEKFFLQTDP